jgi:hypothetical protein
MPIAEFHCLECNITFEKIIQRFAEYEATKVTTCINCGKQIPKNEFPTTLPPMFFGNPEGYHKPSPTKRHSYKTINKKEGNFNEKK